MDYSFYSLFYNKLPNHYYELLPIRNKAKIVTFLNPYYMEAFKLDTSLYSQFDYICSDGMIPILLNNITNKNKSSRISFDMGSVAKDVFNYGITQSLSFYFVGSQEQNIKRFTKIIQQNYPKLSIQGFHHGYINDYQMIIKTIIDSKADIVVIGMGAPKQDIFAIKLKESGYKGTIYTCGGFIHQTTKSINYYPKWINKYNLRFIYRIIHEPHVIKRIIKYYPKFIFKYVYFLIFKCKSFKTVIK